MLEYSSIAELVALAGEGRISRVVMDAKCAADGMTEAALRAIMRKDLTVMRESVIAGMDPDARSMSGMTGGQAAKLKAAVEDGRTFGGEALGMAGAYALAVAECNACMGRIVAAPTAGACGILPGALFTAEKTKGLSEESLIDALFTAAGFGKIIAERASISGAEGGCQAECGSAAAMAAAALTELGGGSAQMCAHAAALALANVMGLVCDPVGGLVEVPCVYRNVSGVAGALAAADMALAGIHMILPADEVIEQMGTVGRLLPESLRETGRGGCAACQAGKAYLQPNG